MQIHATSGVGSPRLPALTDFVSRLAARLTQDGSGSGRLAAGVGEAPTTLTPAMLRATLLQMGVTADAQNLALAEAFTQLGLPLTREALTEAHTALARAPGASPLAYALARATALPTSPAALRGLTAVTGDGAIVPQEALPPELMSWLSLEADAGMEAETLAAHLFVMAQGMGRSTENRVMSQGAQAAQSLASVQDTRTTLLRLAQGSADKTIRRGADALASHIEGQQLINQAARRDPETTDAPFYFALPFQFGKETTLAEMRLWSWDEEKDEDEISPDTAWLRATVRITPPRLGRVQAELAGTLAGTLTCRLGAEKPATARLLHRHSSLLTAALAGLAGWRTSDVECRVVSTWPPLWHGGEALASPRACVDWRA